MPIHFEPPWWRPCLLAQPLGQGSHQRSKPPIAATSAFSSGVRCRSTSLRSQSAGRSSAGEDRLDGQALEAVEDVGENPVEAVDVALVLHQAGAGEVVEALGVVEDEPGVERLEEAEVLAQGDRDPGGAQLAEEARVHQLTPERPARTTRTASRQGERDGVDGGVLQLVEPVAAAPTARCQPRSAPRTKAAAISMVPHTVPAEDFGVKGLRRILRCTLHAQRMHNAYARQKSQD